MEPTSDFAEHVKLAQRETEEARGQVVLARQHLEHAERGYRFWEDLLASLRRGHAAHALLLLSRDSEFVKQLVANDEVAAQHLRELQHQLQEHTRSSVGNMIRAFPKAARDAGIEIDSTSRHPTYTFNQGFLRLEMDEQGFTAKVTPRDGKEIVVGIDLELVVETIRSEQKRLFEREIDLPSFLRSLYTAYGVVLRAENRADGEEIPLRRVTSRVVKNLKSLAADELNVALSRLLQKGNLVVDGKRLHLNHTRNLRQGLLLHGLESGGYMGFVSFKPET